MAKQLSLTVWERVQLQQIIPPRAPIAKLNTYMRLVETLELTPEEKVQVGWKVAPQTGAVTITDQTTRFPISIEDGDFEELFNLAKSAKDWPVSRANTPNMLRQLQDVAGQSLGYL